VATSITFKMHAWILTSRVIQEPHQDRHNGLAKRPETAFRSSSVREAHTLHEQEMHVASAYLCLFGSEIMTIPPSRQSDLTVMLLRFEQFGLA
jgi:hypothetical protein